MARPPPVERLEAMVEKLSRENSRLLSEKKQIIELMRNATSIGGIGGLAMWKASGRGHSHPLVANERDAMQQQLVNLTLRIAQLEDDVNTAQAEVKLRNETIKQNEKVLTQALAQARMVQVCITGVPHDLLIAFIS